MGTATVDQIYGTIKLIWWEPRWGSTGPSGELKVHGQFWHS